MIYKVTFMRDIFSVREYREAYISADSFNEVVEKAVAIRKSEDNEMWITTGYIRILDKISLEDCAWSALLYFIGENTASYKDYEVAFDRIVSPWDSFEL